VSEFIESVKDPGTFLRYCREYHEAEPRDMAYVVSRSIVSKDPGDVSFVLAGAKLIIITWNIVGFQRLPGAVRANLENDILDAYEEAREGLEGLRGERLERLDLDEVGDVIRDVFSAFSSKKSIGFTGASKILHVLNPHVFMMWDYSIRNAYHKLHGGNHRVGDEDCYLEFLGQSRQIVEAVLSERSEGDLWSEHLAFMDERFVKAFSFEETILKMLDECNYVRFKLNVKL